MDSYQTKTKNFVTLNQKSIAQIVAIAEENGFRIYVAWEWEVEAKKGIFGFTKSSNVFPNVTSELIEETANRGYDISGSGEEKRIFANMF